MASPEVEQALQRIADRQKLARRRSAPFLVGGCVAFLVYLVGATAEPYRPDAASGRVYWLLRLGRHWHPAYVTSAHLWFFLVVAAIGVAAVSVGSLIRFYAL
jgi:hypothetical protein